MLSTACRPCSVPTGVLVQEQAPRAEWGHGYREAARGGTGVPARGSELRARGAALRAPGGLGRAGRGLSALLPASSPPPFPPTDLLALLLYWKVIGDKYFVLHHCAALFAFSFILVRAAGAGLGALGGRAGAHSGLSPWDQVQTRPGPLLTGSLVR